MSQLRRRNESLLKGLDKTAQKQNQSEISGTQTKSTDIQQKQRNSANSDIISTESANIEASKQVDKQVVEQPDQAFDISAIENKKKELSYLELNPQQEELVIAIECKTRLVTYEEWKQWHHFRINEERLAIMEFS